MIDRERVRDLVAAKRRSRKAVLAEFLERSRPILRDLEPIMPDLLSLWDASWAILKPPGPDTDDPERSWVFDAMEKMLTRPDPEISGEIEGLRRFWAENQVPCPLDAFVRLMRLSIETELNSRALRARISMRLRTRGRISDELQEQARELERSEYVFLHRFCAETRLVAQKRLMADVGRPKRLNRHRCLP